MSHTPTLERRAGPTNTFERCEKRSWLQGWRQSLGMFRDWLLGTGADARVFGPYFPQSQDLADSPGAEKAREFFYQKNSGLPYEEWQEVTNFKSPFGLSGLISAGVDPTEQFVGSYGVNIFPQPDRTLRFVVTNTTSLESFLYGGGPEYKRDRFPYGGNMKQVYTWIEPAVIP